jgi:hypothetical protein
MAEVRSWAYCGEQVDELSGKVGTDETIDAACVGRNVIRRQLLQTLEAAKAIYELDAALVKSLGANQYDFRFGVFAYSLDRVV